MTAGSRSRTRRVATAMSLVAAVVLVGAGSSVAAPTEGGDPGCVTTPVAGQQACFYQRDWATVGFYLDPGPGSQHFHRLHVTADEFYVPREAPETVLSVTVETCRRANVKRPEPIGTSRCFTAYFLKQIPSGDFEIGPFGATLKTKFGGHGLRVEWTPDEPTAPPLPGRVLTEVLGFGADAEYKSTASVSGALGDYKSCSTTGEFGVGVEEGHLAGRREIFPGPSEPRPFPLVDLAGISTRAKCGDPAVTLREVYRATIDYDANDSLGGALGVHLFAPEVPVRGSVSYFDVTIEDDSGLPTYGAVLMDRDGDNTAEARHMFCGSTHRPVQTSIFPLGMMAFEIQEGPCMYPRFEPLARATTGTITFTAYR